MTPIEMAKKVGIKFDFGEGYEIADKTETEQLHQLRRKVRYFAYAMKREKVEGTNKVKVPKKFKTYFEGREDFIKWEHFAELWDVTKENPIETYNRKFSVAKEWEVTLNRSVPEMPSDRLHTQRT